MQSWGFPTTAIRRVNGSDHVAGGIHDSGKEWLTLVGLRLNEGAQIQVLKLQESGSIRTPPLIWHGSVFFKFLVSHFLMQMLSFFSQALYENPILWQWNFLVQNIYNLKYMFTNGHKPSCWVMNCGCGLCSPLFPFLLCHFVSIFKASSYKKTVLNWCLYCVEVYFHLRISHLGCLYTCLGWRGAVLSRAVPQQQLL